MRAVAIVEGAKAVLVLLVGFGLLSLIHRDVEELAERLVRHSHLDPASKYPRIFINAADRMTDARLWMFAGFAALYSLIRGIEAYGLWFERRWAEWFALLSSGLYLPIEIYEIFHRFTWFKMAVFGTNVGIVVYMAYALRHSREQDLELGLVPPPEPPGKS